MEKYLKYLFRPIVLAVLTVSGCGGGNKSEDSPDARLQYEAERNEVEIMTLKKTVFKRQLISNGKLSAASRSSLSFRGSGTIAEVNAKNGETVREGAVIASLERTEQLIALEAARISMDKAELDLYDVLAGQGYMTMDTSSVPASVLSMAKMRSDYRTSENNLKKAEYDYEGSVLVAPFTGKVADIKLKVYDQSGSEPFCTLIDDSIFNVNFSVLESEYAFIEKGLRVKVSPFAQSNKYLYGVISSINPTVDEHGQVTVTATIKNDGTLIDGMNVKVVVEREVPDCLVVPKTAVVIRDNLEVIFRYKDGKAIWTYVHSIMANEENYVVIPNTDRGAVLSEGDEVIISGNLNLADGSNVVVKN